MFSRHLMKANFIGSWNNENSCQQNFSVYWIRTCSQFTIRKSHANCELRMKWKWALTHYEFCATTDWTKTYRLNLWFIKYCFYVCIIHCCLKIWTMPSSNHRLWFKTIFIELLQLWNKLRTKHFYQRYFISSHDSNKRDNTIYILDLTLTPCLYKS